MSVISKALLAQLEAHAGERGIAALAVVGNQPDGVRTARIPPTLSEEPAFLAYSITKTFTATILLALQEERKLDLDAPLADWLPAVPNAERISLRQVLNHTAGIPDYGGLASYRKAVRSSPSHPWTFDRFIEETYVKGPAFEPGKGWRYSNLGYMFLKSIAERVAGESFSVLISRMITRPLGLRGTFVPERVDDLALLAAAQSSQLSPDEEVLDVRARYHPGWVSHGVVASTPSEIALFFDALFHERIISRGSLRQMTALVPVPDADDSPWSRPSYGLGIMGDPDSRFGVVWGHNGSGPGYQASAFHAPNLGESGITVCVMSGIEQEFDAEEVLIAVLDLLSGGE